MATTKTSNDTYECGSCGHTTDGYTKKELEADGWQFHKIKGSTDPFVLCDACVRLYQHRRQAKTTA
jgi:hypothetical protein